MVGMIQRYTMIIGKMSHNCHRISGSGGSKVLKVTMNAMPRAMQRTVLRNGKPRCETLCQGAQSDDDADSCTTAHFSWIADHEAYIYIIHIMCCMYMYMTQ